MPAEIDNNPRYSPLPRPELFFGTSAGMRVARKKVERAAQDQLPVLIEGESGTGKETLGRFLHGHSRRGDEPFLKLNCGAVPATLLEGKVFGVQKVMERSLEDENCTSSLASVGTLFLNEIEGVESSLQRRIAHALELSQNRSIGGTEESCGQARLICATTIDLEAELEDHIVHELMECFIHRIRLIPLRDRREDIPQLCEYLLGKIAKDFGRPVPHLSSRAVEALQQWTWPGNIRELENWIARIVVFGVEEVVDIEFRRQMTTRSISAPRFHHGSRLRYARAMRSRGHR